MNEKLIVVLLLITIVLSITSVAIVLNLPTIDLTNFARQVGTASAQSSSVTFSVNPSTGGVG